MERKIDPLVQISIFPSSSLLFSPQYKLIPKELNRKSTIKEITGGPLKCKESKYSYSSSVLGSSAGQTPFFTTFIET
jgi:hypothetical protein